MRVGVFVDAGASRWSVGLLAICKGTGLAGVWARFRFLGARVYFDLF